jgi:hypothetical protein
MNGKPTYRKSAALLATPAKRIVNPFLAGEEKPLCVLKTTKPGRLKLAIKIFRISISTKKSAFLTMTSAAEAKHNPCTKPTTAGLENLDEGDA